MRRVVPKAFPKAGRLAAPSDLGEFIRAARTQSGMTLEEAALSLGIAKQTMQNAEKRPERVSFGVLLLVAKGLGVSLFAGRAQDQEIISRAIAQVSPCS